MLTQTKSGYDDDLLLWTQEQARLLREAARAGINFPIDWENVAEEIESLGKSQRHELRNRLTTIIEHLLKLQHSGRREPRDGWEDTVNRSRVYVEYLLEDNPSLRGELDALAESSFGKIAPRVIEQLVRRGEADPSLHPKSTPRYTTEQILGRWWPNDAVR